MTTLKFFPSLMTFFASIRRALSKDGAVAEPGYSRWLMAAAALLVHFLLNHEQN